MLSPWISRCRPEPGYMRAYSSSYNPSSKLERQLLDMHRAWRNIDYLLLYLHSASVSVQVKVIVNGLFVEFLKRQTNGPMVVHSHQLIATKKLYLFMCCLLQVCKFRVGSFNYPMNKMVFYNELIPEDTIIKSILDYK